MRLSTIKLSGFKSFVDSTNVHFPGQRVAIVGPNGCGKSNIIDAVRWVMGESQAKQLRGDSITAVIFNGSEHRKPNAHASVELIFDNSHSTLLGEFSTYNQISVKRVVNREGQSTYYLNGTRCRRRDVTDLFLGTGLGPRSYAIIEQGTISRIIEARPEDLRSYLEEVSGIAKYKERRRETAERMKATSENLDRVRDICNEINKNLEKVEKQAKSAERYTLLKKEEWQTKTSYLAYQWREINEQYEVKEKLRGEIQLSFDSAHQNHLNLGQEIEQKRSQHNELSQQYQIKQESFYQLINQLNQKEQRFQFQQEKAQQIEQELHRTQQSLTHVLSQIDHLTHEVQKIQIVYDDAKPELERLKRTLDIEQQNQKTQEAHWQQIQKDWEQLQQNHAKHLSAAEVAKTQIHHIELRLQENKERLLKLRQQQEETTIINNGQLLQKAQEDYDSASALQKIQEEKLQQLRETLAHKKTAIQTEMQILQQQQLELQKKQGQLASLEAQQKSSLSQNSSALNQWLIQQGFKDHARLGRELIVDVGYEKLVESVLDDFMQAVCLNEPLASVQDTLLNMPKAKAAFVSQYDFVAAKPQQSETIKTLDHFVQGPKAILQCLSLVAVTDTLDQGLKLIEQLPSFMTIATQDGFYLGQGWVKNLYSTSSSQGAIERERLIRELTQDVQIAQTELKTKEESIEALQHDWSQQEKTVDQEKNALSELQQKTAEARGKLNIERSELERKQKAQAQLNQDIVNLEKNIAEQEQGLKSQREVWQKQLAELEGEQKRQAELKIQKENLQAAIAKLRTHTQELQNAYHQSSLQFQQQEQQLKQIKLQLEQAQNQKQHLEKKIETLKHNHEEVIAPQAEIAAEIDTLKANKKSLEVEASTEKEQVQLSDQHVKVLNEQYHELEKQVDGLRKQLENLKLEVQTLDMRKRTIEEQCQELDCDVLSAMSQLQAGWTKAWLEEQLESLKRKIERLGPINLAAIEEFTEISERKKQIDHQVADLEEALQTLQTAIRKIDKETRERFKETFEQVNSHFAELFPSIFGGGEAKLELVGDDLLETGVMVMARPPGKRNSTIHLLSGGEKALTALALVFSLFRLNPAPFCLLDEVDAPLDDANIGRFCSLVKKMSENVQFIFISHNKLAIEMAEQLVGVTMREPGVSRLVAVDIHEAMAMASEGE